MKAKLIISFNILLISVSISAQNTFDIKNPGPKYAKKCASCLEALNEKPEEVQMGFVRSGKDSVYFYISDYQWFSKLLSKKYDGIAVDMVPKDRYDCDTELTRRKKSRFRGRILQPVYLKDIKRNLLLGPTGALMIPIAKIPASFREKEIEFNLILLKNKYLCHYNTFYDIKSYRWDLLEMGMFMDTLTYKSDFHNTITDQEKFILRHKKLKFTISFEKDKAEYSQEDIREVYDSLNLTDFNITNISIRAYSSVEGDEKHNIELQEKRANSIVQALQSYQKPNIITQVDASENWVEFMNDIEQSPYASLAELSKMEVKESLKDRKLAEKLEPYLSKHRKAVIVLDLQKKDPFSKLEPGILVSMFKKSIEEKNLEKAIEIQNSIFDKIRGENISQFYLDKLEIPQQLDFSLLLIRNTVFSYMINRSSIYETFLEMQELEDFLPKDGHIKYNLCALKFKIWLLGEQTVDPIEFKKEIKKLTSYGISSKLIKRMLINYNIVMSEYHMSMREYSEKDKALGYIKKQYKYLNMDDQDYLSLAQYFSSYTKYDWAIDMLTPKVKSLDVNSDLLFYYLNLTLIDEKLTRTKTYRIIMLNAINYDKNRFCALFNPYGEGGITFQLLENDFLKKTYCENCQE